MTSRQTAVPAREPARRARHPPPRAPRARRVVRWTARPGPAVADRRPMRRARTDTAAGYRPARSAADGVPLHAAGVGGRVEHPAIPGHRADPAQRPRRPHRDLVPQAAQLGQHPRSRRAPPREPPAATDSRGVERRREVPGVERGRVDRLLQVHPGQHVPQEEGQRPLVLLVPAGRAEGQVRLTAAQRQAGVSVVRGRLPGARLLGRPGVRVNIWARACPTAWPRQAPADHADPEPGAARGPPGLRHARGARGRWCTFPWCWMNLQGDRRARVSAPGTSVIPAPSAPLAGSAPRVLAELHRPGPPGPSRCGRRGRAVGGGAYAAADPRRPCGYAVGLNAAAQRDRPPSTAGGRRPTAGRSPQLCPPRRVSVSGQQQPGQGQAMPSAPPAGRPGVPRCRAHLGRLGAPGLSVLLVMVLYAGVARPAW